ncbi:fumarylacetoacetate hydrolase family protein [Methylobacterium sp. NEAU 140]|uniref:fumarylacetoacetate hydrolase family protein n=1 Tax=Methylobacterium sp. NEAU 140 TaxID=3064945 RepID=UPI00273495A4|nr:fumarylacetoacetate hydrolase family protein [Methylobacterium sp. NEAU 140]MDP4023668.1 fumarylacetoacetate hydrolase family protein [Methylobacterium sp. NEAU 140]
MDDFVVAPPSVATIPVQGGGQFPVRRIYCVGRNYAAHAREMGADPDREPPFFFSKPADAILACGGDLPYPPQTEDLHFEVELVAAIGRAGASISVTEALDHVFGYAVGIDMTRRDLQDAAKQMRRPWDLSKGFDHSAPIGDIVPVSRIGHPSSGTIELAVDGDVRQSSDLERMIWNVAETVAHLSASVRLAPGDLIFTGTPEGVGSVSRGQTMRGFIHGVGTIETRVVPG